MTVETVTFLSTLNSSLPRRGDLLKEGDAHIRNIKASLKTTFPNFDSKVEASSVQLNALTTLAVVDTDGSTVNVGTGIEMEKGHTIDMGGNKIINTGAATATTDALTFGSVGTAAAQIYPIGTLWVTTSDVDPTGIFGGTWTKAFFAGRTVLGAGSLSGRNFGAGATGGLYAHTLSNNEMPSHSHNGSTLSVRIQDGGSHTHTVYEYTDPSNGHHIGQGSEKIGGITKETSVDGLHSHAATINGTLGNAGSNQPHNILQPYRVANIWYRVS